MPLLHTFSPSPVVLTIGPFFLRWYGLLLAVGVLAAYGVSQRLARRYGYHPDAIAQAIVLGALAGFVGARLYHVVNEWSYYTAHPAEILAVWHGGLAIHGGILFGALTLLWFARRTRLRFWHLTDMFAPGVLLAQAIGRWGNYFNQELFGRPTSLPWGIPIDPANRPVGATGAEYFHPTFLYESLWDGIGFVLLLLMHRHRLRRGAASPFREGTITMAYLVLYALGRVGTELLRIDDVPLLFGIRLPLLVSLVLFLLGCIGLWYCFRRPSSTAQPLTSSHAPS